MRLLILFVFLIAYGIVIAQPRLVVDSSRVTFEILNAGIPVDGSFHGLDASIEFSPDDLDGSRITASIESGTVESGIRIRDKHLRKSDYFHTDSFPTISLTSIDFRHEENARFAGDWILAMKGRKVPISFPFTFVRDSDVATMEATLTLNRLDFDIGGRSPILADEVKVGIRVWGHIVENED